MSPISDLVFHVKRSAVDGKAPNFAGIDRGCSLTKAIYLPKEESEGTATHYALHCVLFHNDNFVECLHFLKKNAKLPDKGIIRVTGVGCDKYRDKIREILRLEVEFVDETQTIVSGLYQFVQAVDDHDELFFQKPEVKSQSFELSEAQKNSQRTTMMQVCKNDGSDAMFPFIYVYVGSSIGFGLLRADGSTEDFGISFVGGKTLIGLGRCIAGIDNYDELMDCAITGQAGNVDTTIEEVIREDKESPYSKFPAGMQMFSLGKYVDQKRSIDSFDRNDRAASAVRLFASIVYATVHSIALSAGVRNVVFSGNGLHGEALRRQMFKQNESFIGGNLNLRFLRTGGTGAFGAMVTQPDAK